LGQTSRKPPPAKPHPTLKARERTGERQIGRVVTKQDSRGNPGCQRNAECARKNEAFGPVPLLGQQNLTKTAESDQHGGQNGDHRQLHDERREEVLLGGEETRSFEHAGRMVS
jgi:hypothetical protein